MKTAASTMPPIMPVDGDHGRMMDYARSPEGKARIDQAQAEIDAGKGIVADDAYFEALKARRARRRTGKSTAHA